MRILLTGGAGFIGSHVLDRLVTGGARIVVVDDFNDYYNPAFKEQNITAHRENPAVKIVRGSITDMGVLEDAARGETLDVIIHLAARAGVRASIAAPLLYQKVNVEGTNNLLELARARGIKRFVFASSSSVYGDQKKTPFSESDPVDHPISPYAATKRATELIAHAYHHLFGINCIGLRFFTAYGERGRPDMAPYLFTDAVLNGKPIKKFGDGTTRRDYTYIADIADGVVQCLGLSHGYEIINLGNNHPVSLNEFIGLLERITGVKANIIAESMQPGDVTQTYADVAKAKRLLDWEAKTPFAEGLERFVAWYKKERL